MASNPPLKVITTWRQMTANTRKHEALLLEMLRHPEATPEMLATLHHDAMQLHKSMRDTQRHLRNKFPMYNWDF